MKSISLIGKERSKFLSNPPKGIFPWIQKLSAKSKNWTSLNWRYWTTVLFSSRAISLPGIPSFSTIEQARLYKPLPSLEKKIPGFWRKLGFASTGKKIPRRLIWTGFHLTTKIGPNGPAMQNLLRDFYSLSDQQKHDLRVLGGKWLSIQLEALHFNGLLLGVCGVPFGFGTTRRLFVFGDKEGKTREIALLDYFSQSVLKKLHQYIFDVLKRIPQDVTFDQGSFTERIKD